VQIEVYVEMLSAVGVPAAPAVATDLWTTIDESSTSSRIHAVPTYDILYARAVADTAPAADTLIRAATLARSIADSAPAADTLIRRLAFPRAIADSAPAADALTRSTVQARAIADSAPAADAVVRAWTGARAIADSAPAADTLLRRTVQARAMADSAPASDALTRRLAFPRAIADSAPAADTVIRSWSGARSIADSAPAVDSLIRLLTYGRFIDEEIGTTAVDPVRTVGRRIAGVVRNSAGTPVVGATVKLVRQSDDRVVRTQTSGAGGAYSFDRDILDTAGRDGLGYYVIAYLAGAPETHGVTDRGLLPILI